MKERKKKGWSKEGRKEEQEERKGTSLFFWQTDDIASLVLLRELGAWDSHKVSSTPSRLTKSQLQCLANKISLNDDDSVRDKMPPQARSTFPTARPAWHNSRSVYVTEILGVVGGASFVCLPFLIHNVSMC